MVAFPPCKINLGLNILRKRIDGYHDIATCFFPLPYTDILEVIPSSDFVFSNSGNLIPGDAKDNLCVKAVDLLRKDHVFGEMRLHLHKIIPAGAGLGGGSSDAAHTLRLVNSVFELGLTHDQLHAYASRLGSDCAFFLHDTPMMGTGRGEILTPVEVTLKGSYVILLNPGVHVSTAQAYAGVTPAMPEIPLEECLRLPVTQWEHHLKNDFESSVFKQYPEVARLKDQLYSEGALYASMSGSGSSVFGIFAEKKSLQDTDIDQFVLWSGFITD